jgi:hypothetical protein
VGGGGGYGNVCKGMIVKPGSYSTYSSHLSAPVHTYVAHTYNNCSRDMLNYHYEKYYAD